MRAFVAIPVPPFTLEANAPPSAAAPAHLTLDFLGEIEPEFVPPIGEAIDAAVKGLSAYDLSLAGVGAFPNSTKPRVVFARVEQGAEATARLATTVREALRSLVPNQDERPFVPHVTLFRVRTWAEQDRARRWLDPSLHFSTPPIRVDRVFLRESELGASGAKHRTVHESPLAA
jgi:RNA 2',3'-cyclic 3'-phosphodiesterase